MRVARALVTALLAAAFGVVVSTQSQQKPPTFRTRLDLQQMDVTVLDRNGRPVLGLTAADFTLLEDGKPKAIEGFAAIELPDVPVDTAKPAWASTVSPDVTTNDVQSQRVFVLVLDDAMAMGSGRAPLWSIREMRIHAAKFIEGLGPADQAAIVFTNQVKYNQNLTADHAKLLRGIAAYPDMDGAPKMPLSCLAPLYQVRTIENVVRELAHMTDRRKSIVYFGGNLVLGCSGSAVSWIWKDVYALAQQHHVTINPVDTQGLRIPPRGGAYLTVAGQTGGHAVINSNDFAPGLREVLVRNSSYYMLAYQRAPNDGRFRRVTVRVNRPDVEVIARKSYWAPEPEPADKRPVEPPPEVAALAGLVPDSTLPLRISAAAFAASSRRAVIALTLGMKQPAAGQRRPETVDLHVRAFTADGDPRGAETQAVPLTLPADRSGAADTRYDVLARIEVDRPGKYEVRVSAHSTLSDTRGSVYIDVDVPDFRNAPVSLSGLLVARIPPGGLVAPAGAFADFNPSAPTSERTFGASEIVVASGRVYQGGRSAVTPVELTLSLRNAAGESVASQSRTIAASAFDANRSAPLEFRLPLGDLKAGHYLCRVDATRGGDSASRDVIVTVR
jgi:VWFA-related protein